MVACTVLMNVVLKITVFIVIFTQQYYNEVFRDVSADSEEMPLCKNDFVVKAE